MSLKPIQFIILLINVYWLLMPVSVADTIKTVCSTPSVTIPNANASGVSDTISLSDTGTLNSVKVTSLNILHQHVGELAATLTHSTTSIKLIDLPGNLEPPSYPCYGKNISEMTLDDSATVTTEDNCNASDPAYIASSAYKPNEPLGNFNGQDVSGDWILTISDGYSHSSIPGTLTKWCLEYSRPNTAIITFSPVSGTTLLFGDTSLVPTYQTIQADNTGGEDLIISEVSLAGTNVGDFSLVTPSSSIPPAPVVTVTPGNSYEVKVQCLPKGPGTRTATLTLKTNLDSLPVLTFPLQCNGIVSQYVWDSSNGNPIDFGTVAVGMSFSKILTVSETGDFADLNLTGIAIMGTNASEFAMVAPATTALTVTKNTSGTLEVQCTPTAGGLRTATLKFNTDDPGQPPMSYSLKCKGDAPSYSAMPTSGSPLQFGTTAVGSVATKTITIKNTGTAALTLSSPAFSSAGFNLLAPDSAAWSLGIDVAANGGTKTIQVQCDTTSVATYGGNLTFSTNDPNQLAVSYPLSCTVSDIPTPQYNSVPAPGGSINLGNVTVGSTATQTVTVMEDGNDTLKISLGNPVFTGLHPSDFSIISPVLPVTINDGGSAVPITIQCKPSASGVRSATLNLVATSTADVPVTNFPYPIYQLSCTGKTASYSSTPVSPGSIIDIGNIAVNQILTYNLSVQETGSAPLTVNFDNISGLQASDFTVDMSIFPFTINNGGATKMLAIHCKPSGLGARTAQLHLTSNDILVNSTPTYTLRCTGLEAVGPAYSSSLVAPGGTLDFGSAAVGQTITQILTISEVGSSVLNVTKGSSLIDGANVSDFSLDSGANSPFAGNNYFDMPDGSPAKTLTITCAPSAVGPRVATLHLKSTDTANPKPTYSLQCQGTASLVPGYSSTPVAPGATLDFGSGPVNVAISKTLTIQEMGNTDLQVDFAGLTGTHAADFKLISPTFPFTIADGGTSQTVIVVCTPSGEGLRTGLLKLTSNDTANSTPAYTLHCTGTQPATLPTPTVIENITPPTTGNVIPSATMDGNNDPVTPTNSGNQATPPSSSDANAPPATEDKNTSVNLTVIFSGNGKGTVTSALAGINCHSDKDHCTATYPVSTAVALTPKADPGSEFSHWEQTCQDSEIVLDNSTTCTAYFRLTLHTLTVSNVGSGTISSTPSGLFCGAGHDSCTHNFTANESVTLIAIPQVGWQFAQWAGDCATGSILVDADKTCQATFVQVATPASSSSEANAPAPVVSASIQAIGKGTVTSDPAGILCIAGTPCTTSFPADTVITLTATPEPGYTFVGWSGTCSGTQAAVAITVDKLSACQAVFVVSSFRDPGTAVPVTTVMPMDTGTPVPATTESSTVATTPVTPVNSTAEVPTDSSSLPRCSTHGEINLACDAQWAKVPEILITPRGYLSNGILIDTLENHGWVSNLTIQEGATLTGGVVSGSIVNAGTMSDFEFRGILIEGGILAGTIHNTSRVGGTIKDVQLAADTTINGGKLTGKIIGVADAPGHLDNLVITEGSYLDNVIIGTDVKWAADVIFGKNVQFVNKTIDDPIAEANQTAQPSTDSVIYLDSNLYISDKILQGDIQGRANAPAFLENVTLLTGSSLTHVIIGQNVKNQGTIADFEFRGAILQGGTLAGEVNNTQAGTFKNVHLAANTHIIGGNMQGSIIGDAKAPALLENVTITAGSYLENVMIGEGTKLPNNVTLGEGVKFVDKPTEDESVDVPPATALEITPPDQTINSPAQFEGKISVCKKEQPNHLMLSRRDAKSLDLATSIVIDPQHAGQSADIFMVARQRLGKTQKDYMRVGDHWQTWDDDFDSLKPAQALEKLPKEMFVLPLFSGDLSAIRGELTVYVGYHLRDGTLVYDGVDPLHFSIDSSPDSCIVYAVHDGGLNNTQFLKFNLSAGLDGEMKALGTVYPGHDIEGLTLDSNNPDILYATAGNNARVKGQHLNGYVYTVNRKTGALTPVGPTGYQQVSGLATHPVEHTLWGWAINYVDGNDKKGVEWMGIISIDPKTGKGTPVKQVPPPIEHDVGGLAWLYDGSKLYASGGDVLWSYDPETQEFAKACDVPEANDGDIEGLDMQPNGLLLMGIDYQTNNNTTIVAYDPKRCAVVTIKTFKHSSFNDIESIIWPAAECNDLSWLNEEPCQDKNGH